MRLGIWPNLKAFGHIINVCASNPGEEAAREEGSFASKGR
jgi:hypothetical protein